MKKGDIIIIASVAGAILALILIFLFCGTKGEMVVIRQNDNIVGSFPISQNEEIALGTNTIKIQNGEVEVVWADCKNQLCKKHSAISKKGESIVCLPNKVIITIEDK